MPKGRVQANVYARHGQELVVCKSLSYDECSPVVRRDHNSPKRGKGAWFEWNQNAKPLAVNQIHQHVIMIGTSSVKWC